MSLNVEFDKLREKASDQWEKWQRTSKPRILAGTATCGRAAGALGVVSAMQAKLAELSLEAKITEVGCIGLCFCEPMVDIIKPGQPRISYGNLNPDLASNLIEDYLVKHDPRKDLAIGHFGDHDIDGIGRFWEYPALRYQKRIVLRNCGFIDPENIDHYIANHGYEGFIQALGKSRESVLEQIQQSGLRGRGGAGFSTATKWELCIKAPGKEKYIICNADEGDPGAFMNRSLLEGDPHSILEGMLIGGYVIGAKEGYIYCREEYPLALARLRIALKQMRDYRLIGEDILSSGFSFDIKLKEGAGAFVCGEETALMASIEGKRGMPRSRPPFPATSGLWEKPTNINNVETWADVATILQKGSDWYCQHGTQKSRGTKTFALAGKVERTGLIEVPLGTSLKTIIHDIGGGIVNSGTLKAVQTGGPSGGCIPAEMLDLAVDYESLTGAGTIMGSGGMIVLDQNSCVVDLARYFLSFTQSESCGKCVPCRVGTRQMLMVLERITRGQGKPEDINDLLGLANTIKLGSLCGLGQTSPNPVLTTVRYFRDEYEEHINQHKCRALVCKDLISFYILEDKCSGCMICQRNCPAGAIIGDGRMVHVIDQEKCIKCNTCFELCPKRFNAIIKVSGENVSVPSQPIPVKV